MRRMKKDITTNDIQVALIMGRDDIGWSCPNFVHVSGVEDLDTALKAIMTLGASKVKIGLRGAFDTPKGDEFDGSHMDVVRKWGRKWAVIVDERGKELQVRPTHARYLSDTAGAFVIQWEYPAR